MLSLFFSSIIIIQYYFNYNKQKKANNYIYSRKNNNKRKTNVFQNNRITRNILSMSTPNSFYIIPRVTTINIHAIRPILFSRLIPSFVLIFFRSVAILFDFEKPDDFFFFLNSKPVDKYKPKDTRGYSLFIYFFTVHAFIYIHM